MAETILTVPTVLNSSFYEFISGYFTTISNRADITTWLNTGGIRTVIDYTVVNFEGLKALPRFSGMQPDFIAGMVYKQISDPFIKIYDALMAEYVPLENYYSIGTTSDEGEGESTRNGLITDTPTGSKVRTYTNHGNIGQGTTFESYGDSDFRNISKTIENGSISDSYQNYSNQRLYNNLTDSSSASKTSTYNKHGNSGIFSKQTLTKQEIELRLRFMLMPLFVSMCVDCVNAGVWVNED